MNELEDPTNLVINRLAVMGAIASRAGLASALGYSFEGARDYYTALGYPKDLSFDLLDAKYQRNDVAGRIVDLPPTDTWRKSPILKDGVWSEKEEKLSRAGVQPDTTPFLADWVWLVKRRKIFHYITSADKLSGIGEYGVMVIGLRGAGAFNKPVSYKQLKGPHNIQYFRAFSEQAAQIKDMDIDPSSIRFGLPKSYEIDFGEGLGLHDVHWTRVVHICEDRTDSEVRGRPRLRRIYNRLEDLTKIVGGSSEATWRMVNQAIHANIREGANYTASQKANLADEVEKFVHGFKNWINTQGVDINTFGGMTVDPTGIFEIILSLISADSGIPQRILIGSERGQLASSQDAENWSGLIEARQTSHAEPNILRPLIDRLVWLGIMNEPKDGGEYGVIWRPIYTLSQNEKATIEKLEAERKSIEATLGKLPILYVWKELLGMDVFQIEDAKKLYKEGQELGLTDFVLQEDLDL